MDDAPERFLEASEIGIVSPVVGFACDLAASLCPLVVRDEVRPPADAIERITEADRLVNMLWVARSSTPCLRGPWIGFGKSSSARGFARRLPGLAGSIHGRGRRGDCGSGTRSR